MLLLTSNQKCQSTEGKSWCTKQLIFRQFFTLETGSWEADGDSTASLHQREVVDLLNVTCPSCSQHSHEQHQVAVTGQRSGTADPVQCWTCVNTAMLQWHCRPCTVLNLRQHSHASVTLQTLYSVEPMSTQPCFSDTVDPVQCWNYVNTAMLQWQCRPCVEPKSTQPCLSLTHTNVQLSRLTLHTLHTATCSQRVHVNQPHCYSNDLLFLLNYVPVVHSQTRYKQ